MKLVKYGILIIMLMTMAGFSLIGQEKAENVAVVSAMPIILADPAAAMDWYDTEVMYNLYSTLVYAKPEGGLEPHLATDWHTVDGKLDHWRFTLRKGVKFHDGTELTAEDVAFSMKRLKALGKGYSYVMGEVTSEVVDKYTVDFLLGKPNAIFPHLLTLFWPVNKDLVLEHKKSGDYGEFGDYGEEWLKTHDAGSGPYLMVSHSPGDRLIVERFKDYFLGWENWSPDTEPIEKVVFIQEWQTSTLLRMLKKGELDIEANGGWSRKQLHEIEDTKGLRLNMTWPMDVTVWINTQVPPTDDIHFRKAIRHAYNYEALLEEYKPFGAEEAGVYLTTWPGYIPIEPQPRKQDLEKAKKELELSKYDPSEVKVVFHYCGGLDYEKEIGLQLQADLAKLGVKAEIAGPPWAQFEAECGAPETTPNLTIFLFAPHYPSPDFYLNYMYNPDVVAQGGIYVAHHYRDAAFGALIESYRKKLELEERVEIYGELQQLIASRALAFYPYQKPNPFASQDYIIGPKNTYSTMVGPTLNMRNWQINLSLKEELTG